MDSGPEKTYFDFLDSGRFMIQRSAATGRHVFYPRIAEPRTGSQDLQWVEPSGLGTVYSSVTVRRRPPQADFNVSIIQLDEGPRLMSRVEGLASDDVRIGLRVRARITKGEQGSVLVFDPLPEPFSKGTPR